MFLKLFGMFGFLNHGLIKVSSPKPVVQIVALPGSAASLVQSQYLCCQNLKVIGYGDLQCMTLVATVL
jgi:hypothetical protein